jgi:hypothetical protein
MVAKRDLCAMNMPVMIFSTPTKNNTTEMRMTSERNVRPGNAIAMPDTIMANMPKPICAKRIQRGDDDTPPFCSVI